MTVQFKVVTKGELMTKTTSETARDRFCDD